MFLQPLTVERTLSRPDWTCLFQEAPESRQDALSLPGTYSSSVSLEHLAAGCCRIAGFEVQYYAVDNAVQQKSPPHLYGPTPAGAP